MTPASTSPTAPARPLPTVASLRAGLTAPDPSARPMMRWWWFGPEVEHAEIDRELRAMSDAGIGGAEVAFVYPLGDDPAPFLSSRMLEALRHAAETARDLGLRFDVTLGSGWSYGGAHIGPEHAARQLHWERREIGAESFEIPLDGAWPGDRLLAVFASNGAEDHDFAHIPREPDAAAQIIPAGRGPRTVLLAWSRLTGQQVKRAAAGAEGPVLDHYSAAATRHHLDVVGGAILGAVPAELIGSVFSDSLEVYGANWTPALPEEFRRRRGYDPIPLLHLLAVPGSALREDGTSIASADLRADMGRTLTELVEDGFVATFRDWAHEHGVRFRLQGYGEPPIAMSANRLVDCIEGEGAGWKGITQTRWATSAAHLYDRELVSTETWTWTHSPSFRATPLDLKGEAHEHLLMGSTLFVGHGWPYSPPDVPGLGWYFYASGALDDRNPWWPAMPSLMRYLTGLCSLLRAGRGVADVKLYLPYEDVRAEHEGAFDLWRSCRDRIGPQIPAAIREGGWDLDLIDDQALDVLDPAEAPLVVLPDVVRLPETARAWCDAVRAAGGTVIAVDAAGQGSAGYPQAVPATPATLDAALRAALPPVLTIDGGDGDIGIVHRALADGDLLLVANTAARTRTLSLAPRAPRAAYEAWDPATGAVAPVDLDAVVLAPYEAIVLVGTDSPGALATDEPGTAVPAPAPRTAPVPRAAQTVPLELAETGPGTHEARVVLDPAWAQEGTRIVLDLGPGIPAPAPDGARGYRTEIDPPVREIAVVDVDGTEAGILWDAPHRLDLTAHLAGPQAAGGTGAPARRTLRLRVHGTAARALAEDPHAEGIVARSHERYGQRFRQQDLGRALDGLVDGIPGTPVLLVGRDGREQHRPHELDEVEQKR